jgi:hypothetical protein
LMKCLNVHTDGKLVQFSAKWCRFHNVVTNISKAIDVYSKTWPQTAFSTCLHGSRDA